LSVTGQELHEQTVGLTATRKALESERERYQALFEFAPVAYLVTDPVARILEANRATALLDVDQRFLVGKPLAAYVASEDRWQFRSTVNRLRRADGNRVATSRSSSAAAAAGSSTPRSRSNRCSAASRKRWPPLGRSTIVPSCSWPASGSGGNAARVSRLGRWPGSRSKA
jgi:PAS domain S-box-containing protein